MPTSFTVLNIRADGYERTAHIISDSTKEFFVSFIAHEEYSQFSPHRSCG